MTFNDYPPFKSGQSSDVVILGVPYDNGVTGPTGQRAAPDHIRSSGFWPHGEIYDARTDHLLNIKIVDAGDVIFHPGDSHEAAGTCIASMVSGILPWSKLPIFLGGDNSVTRFIVETISEQLLEPIHVVAFDAHYDAWDEDSNHGTWIRDLFELECLASLDICGVRAYGPTPDAWSLGNVPITLHTDTSTLPSYDEPTYLAIDIDAIDPGQAPGTGMPEPFGMTSTEVRDAMEQLILTSSVVGMDITEVLPSADERGRTSALAQRLVMAAALAVSRRDSVS